MASFLERCRRIGRIKEVVRLPSNGEYMGIAHIKLRLEGIQTEQDLRELLYWITKNEIVRFRKRT